MFNFTTKLNYSEWPQRRGMIILSAKSKFKHHPIPLGADWFIHFAYLQQSCTCEPADCVGRFVCLVLVAASSYCASKNGTKSR